MRCFSTMAQRWTLTPPGCTPGLPVTLVLGCEAGLGDWGPGGLAGGLGARGSGGWLLGDGGS